MTLLTKKLTLLSVKYGPGLMAVTCALNCLLLTPPSSWEQKIIHLTNIFLDIILLTIFWIEGKAMGFCWKHRAMCRITFYGYVYAIIVITTGIILPWLEVFYLGVIFGFQLLLYYEGKCQD